METCAEFLRSIKVSNDDNEAQYILFQVGECNYMCILVIFIHTGKCAMQ